MLKSLSAGYDIFLRESVRSKIPGFKSQIEMDLHVKRLPVSLNGYPVSDYVEANAKVQQLDFDILVPGHGNLVGEKADLTLYLNFLRALEAAVSSGIAEGRSVEEMRENLSFSGYEDWLLFETRKVGLITEAYELLTGDVAQ